MKKIEAFIRHEAFEPIRMELLELGFPSLSISEVKGSGRQKGITERYRGAELTNWLRPKVKLECVVPAVTCRRSSTRSSSTPVPARSATARCSSCPSRRHTGSARASPAKRPCRPTRGRRTGGLLKRRPRPSADLAGGYHSRPAYEGGVLNVAMEVQPEDRGATVMQRVRAVHLRMVDAVLSGDGLEGVAEARGLGDRRGGGDRRPAPRRGGGVRPGRRAARRCAGTSASGRATAQPPCRRGSWPRCRSPPVTSSSARCSCSARTSRPPRRWSSCTSPRWRA